GVFGAKSARLAERHGGALGIARALEQQGTGACQEKEALRHVSALARVLERELAELAPRPRAFVDPLEVLADLRVAGCHGARPFERCASVARSPCALAGVGQAQRRLGE